jgi:beta-glucosidase
VYSPETVLASLTLKEKAALLSGSAFWSTTPVERLGVPALALIDGPHGVRKQLAGEDHLGLNHSEPATAFPTASATGSSWDPDLLEEVGAALAIEGKALGVNVLLGPGINIKRTPLCGRNFEYFSEDPYLSGTLGSAWVKGLQAGGVGASVKHFAANNQETNRMRISVEADERTLREIYLPAFERVVKDANPATVMSSYNGINGVPASQNPWLLTEVLRHDWGYQGVVVSDWGAVLDAVASVKAGLDLEMPSTSGRSAALITAAVESGELDEEILDRAALRVLHLASKLGQARQAAPAIEVDRHHALARKTAAASAVLLTNEDAFLPFSAEKGGRIAVIGEFARTPRYQGAGSSHVQPTRLENALDEISRTVMGHRQVTFAPGFTLDDTESPDLITEAVAAAREAEDVILFLGLPDQEESEGFDRSRLDLPAKQMAVLRAVAAANPRVAVVLSNGGVVLTRPVEDHAAAVLELWLGGQASGGAAADILFGTAEPSGRLAETIPLALADNPAHVNFPGTSERVHYGERLYVGYRWYDATGRDVAHPFGHGMSYTTFEYSGLEVSVPDPATAAATVSFTITNTGSRNGTDVAQIYVSDTEASVDRPRRELKAFQKVTLEPGESRQIHLALDERAFAFWSESSAAWIVEPGTFRVSVGRSSRDLPLVTELELHIPKIEVPLTLESTLYEWLARPSGHQALSTALTTSLGEAMAKGMLDDDDTLRVVGSIPLGRVLNMGAVSLNDKEGAALLALANTRPADTADETITEGATR